VTRELLKRAWAAGAGPGAGPLTIDLDSTICEISIAVRQTVAARIRGGLSGVRCVDNLTRPSRGDRGFDNSQQLFDACVTDREPCGPLRRPDLLAQT
jgi:hypothetical protein